MNVTYHCKHICRQLFLLLTVFALLSIHHTLFAANSSAFTFTDKDTGLTFVVPDNWEQKELSKERDVLDVFFVYTKDNWVSIGYGSNDLWEEFSSFEKTQFSRSESNLSHFILSGDFTKSDFAKEYGVTEDKVDIVTYNGNLYVKVEMLSSAEVNGLTFSKTVTQLFNIVDGRGYYFIFSGTSDSEYYADFEKLVTSVQYPISSTDKNATKEFLVLFAAFGVVVLFCICIAFLRHKIRKKKAKPDQSKWIICQKCDEILPGDSKFCYKCGSKLDDIL